MVTPIRRTNSEMESRHFLPSARPAAPRMRLAMSTTVDAVEMSARKATPPAASWRARASSSADVLPMRRGPYTRSLVAGSRNVPSIRPISPSRSEKYSPVTTPRMRKGFPDSGWATFAYAVKYHSTYTVEMNTFKNYSAAGPG